MLSRFLDGLDVPSRLLDAGCGSGRDLAFMAARGHQVAGIDASGAMCDLARAATPDDVTIRHMRLEAFRDPPRSWGGIWCLASLLHVAPENAGRVLDRFCTSLRPGGRLFVSVKAGKGTGLDSRGRPMAYWSARDLVDLLGPRPATRLEAWEDIAPASDSTPTRWSNLLFIAPSS